MSHDAIPTKLNNYSGEVEVKTHDVLCGSRDTSLGKHTGNILLRRRVIEHLDEYEAAKTKQDKIKINRTIMQYMRHKYNARFLRQKGNGDWIEADEQCVRDKISHALRFASIQRKKDQEYQQRHAPCLPEVPSPPASVASADDEDGNPAFAQMLESAFERQQAILRNMMRPKPADSDDDILKP